MPFCPSCGYEYVEGLERCNDCQEILVSQLSEDEESQEKWVVLREISLPSEARMIHGLLLNNDIPAVVEDLRFGMMPETFGDLSVVRIFVKEKDVNAAEELIEEVEAESSVESEEE